MALTKTLDFSGISVPDAHIEVQMPTIAASGDAMTFYVVRRVASGKDPYQMNQYECAYDAKGSDPFTQAYAYLLTLTEFNGATETS